MKILLLASCTLGLAIAQDKGPAQLVSPAMLLEFPKFTKPSTWNAALADLREHEQVLPASLEFTFKVNPSAVCSVPLLEAHVDGGDAAMATAPLSLAVPIPKARVPAPACPK